MKSFYTSLIIVSFCLVSIFFLIFGFTFLKHFTDWKIVDVKETVEFWCMIITPTVAIVGTYFVVTSFKQQVKANKIQNKTFEQDKKRYDIDRGYSQSITYLEEVQKFKSVIILIDNTGIKTTEDKAINAFTDYIFYKSQIPPINNLGFRNLNDFYKNLLEYLQIVEMTADYISVYYELKDNSFLILRKKFNKAVANITENAILIDNSEIDANDIEFYNFMKIFRQAERTHSACRYLNRLGDIVEEKIF